MEVDRWENKLYLLRKTIKLNYFYFIEKQETRIHIQSVIKMYTIGYMVVGVSIHNTGLDGLMEGGPMTLLHNSKLFLFIYFLNVKKVRLRLRRGYEVKGRKDWKLGTFVMR